MAVTLNGAAFDHAKELIASGNFVYDDRDAWSEHRAGQYKHFDIEKAAHQLHQMMDPRKGASAHGRSRASGKVGE